MSQGIFISYRREDSSQIAATIYDALSLAFPKKRVFLDVDAPAPGSILTEKIEGEIEFSQVVIVVIGPRWNATRRLENENDYVRRELRHALRLRDQKKLMILPVLVGGATMPTGGLPDDVTGVTQLEYLQLADDGGIPQVVEHARLLLPIYWVGGHDDIVRWCLDWVDLLKHLIQLDVDEVPTIDAKPRHPVSRLLFEVQKLLERIKLRAPDPGDEGYAEQWALIFERHPQTWRLVLNREDEIVAYWHVAPLKTEDYRQLIAGRFKAGMVTYEKLTLFEKKAGIYNLFFVITVVDERHRSAALHRYLFFSFFEVLDTLATAEEPVFIAEVAADVWTDEGVKLAEGFGMERVGRRVDNPSVLIYSVPIVDVLNDYIAKQRYPTLRERYRTAGFALE
jgi:TIR domain